MPCRSRPSRADLALGTAPDSHRSIDAVADMEPITGSERHDTILGAATDMLVRIEMDPASTGNLAAGNFFLF